MKSSHNHPTHRPQESSRNAPKKKDVSSSSLNIGMKDYERLLKRTKELLSAYGTKLKQTKSINKALLSENSSLKSRLNRYEKP